MDRDALRRDLEAQVEGDVRFDTVSRALYSTDASVYQIEPTGVVVPKTREDLVRIVAICRRHGCSITMRGGGTSQAGQAIGEGLQVDTSKYLNRLLEVNPVERWARVEPGIVLDHLNDALRTHGLRFAPDISTASRATVGGMMANNSSGARSVLYGKTIDHVLEQTVVLSDGSVVHLRERSAREIDLLCAADTLEGACHREVRRLAATHAGEIERRYPKVLRRVGGYNLDAFVSPDAGFNLAKLMVGSEGTLGIVVEAKIALVPLPKAKAVMAIQFHDLLDALEATPAILAHRPSAIEVMDRYILDNTKQSPALDRKRRTFIDGDPAALLCVEMYDDDPGRLSPRFDALERDLVERRLGDRFFRAMDGPAQATIWSLREAALGLSMANKDNAKSLSFVEDTAVAPERLRAYIDRFLRLIATHGTRAGIYAHASVGCLHVRPVINLKTAEGITTFETLAADVADLVLEFGGALSGEHGDGLVRSPFMEKMFGPVLYQAFRDIKRTFDPDGLFNPGKIVDAPPLTANLRYGTAYQAASPVTFFDYDEYGGIAGAVEMCSGLGACRKTLDGTMCPSYMATRDETHSTRGRANVLRLALAGRLGESGLGDDGVKEVMALCLECRACKAECPVGVDVARFKSEFLASYWQRHGTPLRARMLGHVHDLARWGSRLAPLSNVLARSTPVRWMNHQIAGIDARRTPPAWTSDTFATRFRRECAGAAAGGRANGSPSPRTTALVFNDTFTNYYNPGVGVAGVKMLQKAGCATALAPNVCCGRPLISQGLLAAARTLAARNAEALAPAAEQGAAIVFLEPSCLSAAREDAPALLRGDLARKARRVAESMMLFEEFVERIWPPDLEVSPGPSTVVLHGHCHQKAMGLLAPAMRLLSRIPGAEVIDLDAGCCGMAGSFGYLAENFDVSRAIGERRLLPAARALPPGAVLVASGVSCRHQVEDFTRVRPVHPAELLHSLTAEIA
ncbi:MAG TPA: FAD-linked oxidase C-terminal domain-containing protein [Vicinamibacterales bacterium]|nr:FAD-linked oxidase C-terminal domain-containing protein [Vicinamibacterales bacterium]